MEEVLVGFKVAAMAKEKGFGLNVLYYYDGSNMIASQSDGVFDFKNYNLHKGSTFKSAPTQSLLQNWIREKYQLQAQVEPIEIRQISSKPDSFKYYGKVKLLGTISNSWVSESAFDNYEEALEYTLKNALELIKTEE